MAWAWAHCSEWTHDVVSWGREAALRTPIAGQPAVGVGAQLRIGSPFVSRKGRKGQGDRSSGLAGVR